MPAPKRGVHRIGPSATKRRKTAAEKTEDLIDAHIRRLEDYPDRCRWIPVEVEAENGTQFQELLFDGQPTELVAKCLRPECQELPMSERLIKKTKPHLKKALNKHERDHVEIDVQNGDNERDSDDQAILKNIIPRFSIA